MSTTDMSLPAVRLGRRDFLKSALASGGVLALGFNALGQVVQAADAVRDVIGPNVFGAWLMVSEDNVITLVSPEVEYGQGTATANAMLVAEELDADWTKIKVVPSDAAKLYTNPGSGRLSTDGSWGMRGRVDQMRLIGAKARVMLVQAAAAQWGVPASECTTSNSIIAHAASKRFTTYGLVAADAMKLPIPADMPLRTPDKWRLIGTSVRRLDIVEKCTGRAKYSVDLKLPGMLHAAFNRCPIIWGGTVKSVDDTVAKARKGVRHVFNVGYGVAVLADDPWTARKAADELQITWNEGEAANLSSATIARDYARALDNDAGVSARDNGNVDMAAKQAGVKTISADYTVPFLMHQCMEPTGCTAWVHDGICEFWTPTAAMGVLVRHAHDVFGFSEEQVKVHRAEFVGGSFGLRGRVDPDLEAAQLSIKAGGVPVHVLRRREEDVQHGWFRPYQKTRIKATLDAGGNLIAWNHKVAVQSINAHYSDEVIPFGVDIGPINEETRKESAFFRLPVDFYATAGSPHNLSYQIPNLRVVGVQMEVPVPVNHWRSVGFSGNTFITESMVDELAVTAKKDPFDFRRTLLRDKLRPLAVLDALAAEMNWSARQTNKRGTGWGVAYGEGFASYCAIGVLVTVRGKKLSIDRVVCVYDHGITVNLDQTEAQVQGGLIDGLSATMFGEITIEKGRVQQNNFHDYRLYTLANVPPIQIKEVVNKEKSGSITEIITPTVMPAVSNAIFAATGQRIRELPLKKHGFEI
ncbi:MAG: molybdopterin-dependent oxidoreductase [Steroidobacteraceae bacterium]